MNPTLKPGRLWTRYALAWLVVALSALATFSLPSNAQEPAGASDLATPAPGPMATRPGNDFAVVTLHDGTLVVTAMSQPGAPFDIVVSNLAGIPTGRITVTLNGAVVQTRDFDHEDVVILTGFPAEELFTYEVSINDASGILAQTGKTPLVSLDIMKTGILMTAPEPDPDSVLPEVPDLQAPMGYGGSYNNKNTPASKSTRPSSQQVSRGGGGGGSCYVGSTNAGETWYGGGYPRTSGLSTSAQSLSRTSVEADWSYWANYYGGGGTPSYYAYDALSFGHGWFGANQMSTGERDMAVGHAVMGSRNAQTVYNSACRGYYDVGHWFSLGWPQVFYENVRGNVIANHKEAVQTTMGLPQQSCSETWAGFAWALKQALDLTRAGSAIEPFIPDKWCKTNWKELNSANGKAGKGIESYRASQGNLEAADGYIRTLYSSTGEFTMEFGGYAKYDAYFNACNGCAARKYSYWAGFDDQVWSPAKIV